MGPDSSSHLLLQSRIKYNTLNGNRLTRVRSVRDTLNEILPLCEKIGITRISDITFMDNLYIPNFSTVLPGIEDSIWVYSGNGQTKEHAKASALMETIERYSSLSSSHARSFIQGNYLQLSKSYNKVLHPSEVVETVNPEYNYKDAICYFIY